MPLNRKIKIAATGCATLALALAAGHIVQLQATAEDSAVSEVIASPADLSEAAQDDPAGRASLIASAVIPWPGHGIGQFQAASPEAP